MRIMELEETLSQLNSTHKEVNQSEMSCDDRIRLELELETLQNDLAISDQCCKVISKENERLQGQNEVTLNLLALAQKVAFAQEEKIKQRTLEVQRLKGT